MSSSETILKRVKLEAFNGCPPLQYSIQLVDKSTVNEAEAFMLEHFRTRENLSCSIVLPPNCESDSQTKREAGLSIWAELLEKGFSLAAFLKDEQGNRGPMISCNVLDMAEKDSKKTENVIISEVRTNLSRVGIIMQTLEVAKSNVDVFTLYNCSSYVDGVGLAVAEDFQGRGIATEMLLARGEVCRLLGTPVSATVFTGVASQRAAQKCGYETLSELDLRTYKINGQIVYPNPQTPIIKFMAKRYY